MTQRHLQHVMSTVEPEDELGGACWAAVYVAEAERLMRLATVLVGVADAHDLVVDTVQRVVSGGRWSAVSEPGAYLGRALVNAAHATRRAQGRRTAREFRVRNSTVTAPVDPANTVDVQRALALLTVQQRAIAYFVYWEDLSIPMVAARLDVTEGTVRKQLARAKDRLREVLR